MQEHSAIVSAVEPHLPGLALLEEEPSFRTAPWMSRSAASFMLNTKTLRRLHIACLAEPALVMPCR
jgi:hypothetical protein